MANVFGSEFSNVRYLEKEHIVFLKWKKFCCYDDYRNPTTFALNLLRENPGSNFVIDARNGFEDEQADVEWGFSFLLPEMAKTDCRYVVFIMNEVNEIEEEMDMWTREFMKYFVVKKVEDFPQAKAFLEEAAV